MTEAERKAEMVYRLTERLGISVEDREPTEAQYERAVGEVNEDMTKLEDF